MNKLVRYKIVLQYFPYVENIKNCKLLKVICSCKKHKIVVMLDKEILLSTNQSNLVFYGYDLKNILPNLNIIEITIERFIDPYWIKLPGINGVGSITIDNIQTGDIQTGCWSNFDENSTEFIFYGVKENSQLRILVTSSIPLDYTVESLGFSADITKNSNNGFNLVAKNKGAIHLRITFL